VTIELWIQLGAALLGLVHVTAASFAFKKQLGNRYTVGARNADRRPTGMAGRLYRAQTNFLETFPVFAAVVLVVQVAGLDGGLSLWGSVLYLAARLAYLPLYALGVPWLRSFTWDAATLGIVLVGLQVVL
jgi:uncharacterized MAPEG superfamily protein